jgi:hypothetical protein
LKKNHQVAKIHLPPKKKTPMKNIMMMIKVSIPNIDWRGRRNFGSARSIPLSTTQHIIASHHERSSLIGGRGQI